MALELETDQIILGRFKHVLVFFNDLLTSDIGVTLTDREKYLLYKPGQRLVLDIAPGDPVKVGSAIHTAMTERRRVVMRVDKSLFGKTCIAAAIPIYNERNEIIGAVSVQETIERQEELKEMATRLTDSISVLASSSEEIAAQTEEISLVSHNAVQAVQASQDRVKETSFVLNAIQRIANQTNLLGLNASIEAARVGDLGRGFGVVANEIRKMASESTECLKKTGQIINTVQQDSVETFQKVTQINSTMEEVSKAIEHMALALQVAGELATKLDGMANALSSEEKS